MLICSSKSRTSHLDNPLVRLSAILIAATDPNTNFEGIKVIFARVKAQNKFSPHFGQNVCDSLERKFSKFHAESIIVLKDWGDLYTAKVFSYSCLLIWDKYISDSSERKFLKDAN